MSSVSSKPTYIYALCEPGTEVVEGMMPPPEAVRYVGKTVDLVRRYKRHLSEDKRAGTHVRRWLNTMKLSGSRPVLCVIETVEGTDWSGRERYWIAHYRARGARLVNLTIGGGGEYSPDSITLAQISANIRAAKGQPAARARTAIQARARWADPAYKERVTAAITKGLQTDAAREKLRESARKNNNTPTYREKMAMITSEGMKNPLRIARLRQTTRDSWQNPEIHHARVSNASAKRNTSGYIGVCFDKHWGKWRAYLYYQGRLHHLGAYKTPEEAARARDAKAIEVLGEHAVLNF